MFFKWKIGSLGPRDRMKNKKNMNEKQKTISFSFSFRRIFFFKDNRKTKKKGINNDMGKLITLSA
jgi:hypothetical protein